MTKRQAIAKAKHNALVATLREAFGEHPNPPLDAKLNSQRVLTTGADRAYNERVGPNC